MFERYFDNQLSPWTRQDLKLECKDCGVNSEAVFTRTFPHKYDPDEYFDLCEKCYNKLTTQPSEEGKDADQTVELASKRNVNAIRQTAALQVKTVEGSG